MKATSRKPKFKRPSLSISAFSCLFSYDIWFAENLQNTVVLQEWRDVNMQWNKSEYGDVGDIRIPPHKLWKPDVLMYNR